MLEQLPAQLLSVLLQSGDDVGPVGAQEVRGGRLARRVGCAKERERERERRFRQMMELMDLQY